MIQFSTQQENDLKIPLPQADELQPLSTVPIKAEEAREQARLVAALRRHWSKIPKLAERPIIYHVPNGGQRDPREAANLKVQGALAGVPDLEIVLPKGRCLKIEMKASDGRLSKSQIELHDHLSALGHPVVTAYSAEDALNKLQQFNWEF